MLIDVDEDVSGPARDRRRLRDIDHSAKLEPEAVVVAEAVHARTTSIHILQRLPVDTALQT